MVLEAVELQQSLYLESLLKYSLRTSLLFLVFLVKSCDNRKCLSVDTGVLVANTMVSYQLDPLKYPVIWSQHSLYC